MDGHLRGDVVYAGGDARQRFYDSAGYGRPLEDDDPDRWGPSGVALSPVEAAHLLYRGDLDAVERDGDRLSFREFLGQQGGVSGSTSGAGFLVRFLVYADLRDRGFYMTPAREGWPNTWGWDTGGTDFVVYERGSGPQEGGIAHRVRAVGERESVALDDLSSGDLSRVLAVIDEESDVTYFQLRDPDLDGATAYDPPSGLSGALLSDRAVVWDPPADLYDRGFFGRPLARDGDAVQLSLVEAAYLVARGAVELGPVEGDDAGGVRDPDVTAGSLPLAESADPPHAPVVARGRAVEGERFDRRLRTYAALRDRGVVPKTGFKFGADFRTYAEVESVEDLGHSELLVRALPADARVSPRDLALDVRLAHGVRKEMVFALVGEGGIEWLSVGRLTP